jgi:DNA-binding MarR family transcriptional regulator
MVTRADSLLLDGQLCFALYRASRAMIRAHTPLLEPLGLTYPQYLTLLALWEVDGSSIKQLGERLTLDSATLTPLLKRLEIESIVERRRDTQDERVVRIHLTRRGRALQAKAAGIPLAMACKVGTPDDATLAKVTKLREELQALASTLEAVR